MKLYLKFKMFLKLSEMNYIVEPQDCQNFVNIPYQILMAYYVKTSDAAALV